MLEVAIEQLYETFARYRLNAPIEYCTHCHSAEEIRLLQTYPIRDLTGEHLADFTSSLMLTAGSVRDFKHFLPRIFELAVTGWSFWGNPEITLGLLRLAAWRRWPASEQRAIEQYLMACWQQVLATLPEPFSPHDEATAYLCAIAQAEDDLTPYITVWSNLDTLPALAQLARSAISDWSMNPFWRDWQAQREQVADYMLEQGTIEKLERAFFTYEAEEVSDEFAAAVDQLYRARKRRNAAPCR